MMAIVYLMMATASLGDGNGLLGMGMAFDLLGDGICFTW